MIKCTMLFHGKDVQAYLASDVEDKIAAVESERNVGAKMLARQCDLAREAEMLANRQRKIIHDFYEEIIEEAKMKEREACIGFIEDAIGLEGTIDQAIRDGYLKRIIERIKSR